MKTPERILSVALMLFNEHGETAVTSVDIANECDISPGNLYYHFKGKEQLVESLMRLHKAQMNEVLDPKNLDELITEDLFYYLFMLIQHLHLYHFLYRSPADLYDKYPSYRAQHKQLVGLLQYNLGYLFKSLKQKGVFFIEDEDVEQLTDLVGLIMTQGWQTGQKHDIEYHTLALLLVVLEPRCQLSDEAKQTLSHIVQQRTLPSVPEVFG